MTQPDNPTTSRSAAAVGISNWLLTHKSARAVVVTAHPDDEVMWAGGLLNWWHDNGEQRLTVYCCSIPETEPERAAKFFDVCSTYGAFGRINPFMEVRGGMLNYLEYVDLSNFELAFTHNFLGEYGHIHHQQVYRHVLASPVPKVYSFGYGTTGGHELQFDWEEKFYGIRHYNHQSALLKVPKWQELMGRWGKRFDLKRERYIKVR